MMLVPKKKKIVNMWEKNIVLLMQSKKKCVNCKKLPYKYTINSNFFLIMNYYILIDLLNYCAHRLLSVQPYFASQKYEIDELIIKSANKKHYLVIDYLKYHYELNHIEHFWYNAEKWAWENCNYSLDNFC